ncbi:MAG: IPT/TIG domain-containing protein [Sporocytophaga sp.]|nr:IPT/TIG domain-containing protein [Sporocytophaga sp.]
MRRPSATSARRPDLPAGGQHVTITGTGFQSGVTATIAGVGCAVTSSSATQIACTTGPAAAGTAQVVVINPDVQTGTGGPFTITNPAPTVSAVSPSTGSLAGGYLMSLSGTGFIAGTTVQVGSNNCPIVSIAANGKSLSCTVPAGSVSTVNVTVSAPGSSTVNVTNGFSYSNGSSLFWANSGSPASLTGDCSTATSGYGSIGSSNSLAGTSINQCLVVPNSDGSDMSYPGGVATDGTYIYWADSGSQVIGRANADGSDPQILINLGATNASANPTGVAIANGNIYWTDGGFSGSAGSIGYANVNGSSVHQHWITLAAGSSPSGLAITGGTIYWSDSVLNVIGEADLAHGTVLNAKL